MKLNEALHQAAHEPDPFRRKEQIEQVVNFMRFRFNWTAAQCSDAAVKSGITAERWEDLLMEVDNP